MPVNPEHGEACNGFHNTACWSKLCPVSKEEQNARRVAWTKDNRDRHNEAYVKYYHARGWAVIRRRRLGVQRAAILQKLEELDGS